MTSLDANIRTRFIQDGFAVVRGFYDESEIRPIQEGIKSVIELVARKYGVAVQGSSPEAVMARTYLDLISANRAYGGEIYDAVKQIPEFLALVANAKNRALFEQIRPGSIPGIAAGGFGIRIDNPGEEKFRAPWHQEFPAQLRSIDGVVFWSPLLAVIQKMGPVELCPGSHREGPVPVYQDEGGLGKSGAYALRLDREPERLAKYSRAAPLTEPGDLLVMDFLTLHASGLNVSDRSRWTMQWRMFNFADPTGIKIGWRGSFAAGIKFQDVMPELVAGNPPIRA
jgi:hypothetical protein